MRIQERINKLRYEIEVAEKQLHSNIQSLHPGVVDNVSSRLRSSSLSMNKMSLPLFSLGSMLLLGKNKKIYTIAKAASTFVKLVQKLK